MPQFNTYATFDIADIDSWAHDKAKVYPTPIKCVHGPVAITWLIQYYPKGTRFLDGVDTTTPAVGLDFVEQQNDQVNQCVMELRSIQVVKSDGTLEILKQCSWKPTKLDRAVGRYEYELQLPTSLSAMREKGSNGQRYVKGNGSNITFHIFFEITAESFLLSQHLRKKLGSCKLFTNTPKTVDIHLRELYDPIERASIDGKKPKTSAANWCLITDDGTRFYVHSDIIENSGSEWLIDKAARDVVFDRHGRPKSVEKLPERPIKHMDSSTLRECLRVIYLHVEPQRFKETILDLYDAADYLKMDALKFECVIKMLQMCEDGTMSIEKIVRWCRVVHDAPEMSLSTELQQATINIIITRFQDLNLKLKEKLNAHILPQGCTLYHLIMEHMCANHVVGQVRHDD